MDITAKEGLLAEVRQIALDLLADLHALHWHSQQWREPEAYPLVQQALDRSQVRLANLNLWGEANRLPSGEFWKIAGGVLELGWLQNHARTKPRGYAGDFEMLAKICDQWRCEHPLGALFDRYFQSEAAPSAVRNRTQLMAELIAAQCLTSQDQFRVVSVGSGSGEDVRRAASSLPEDARRRLHVTLIDIDPDSLEYATHHLTGLLAPNQIDVRRENLFRLPRNRKLGEQLTGSHLVYCTGLFDYLNVADGSALLHTMWSWLAPGGRTLAFNFTLPNPTRTYMEWIGNWYLTYRTREEMALLAFAAGIPESATTLGCEAAGVNLYVEAIR